MMLNLLRSLTFHSGSLPFFFSIITCCLACQREPSSRSWSVYKADPSSSSYSPLDQVTAKNVSRLEIAWTFNPNDAVGGRRGSSECNPIVIDNVLYATSARRRLYAVNASNGTLQWSFDPYDGGEGGGVNRGVTYWEDGQDRRILFAAGEKLFARDAETGKAISEFGRGGMVNLNVGLRGDSSAIMVSATSPGIIFEDLIIVGGEVSELYGAEPGYVRAYDVKSGNLVWTFHTIPLPGEPGYETWPKDAWKYAGGANDWGGMSVDTERGMVFLALGSPSYDFYGANRKGQNLYGNSVVALDAKTGAYIWHFQTVHHDLWDYDLPAPPNLITIRRDGKSVDAVAQTTKTGFVFVFDRETGDPLFPIEERSVPASRVPGEEAWPTQPFPLKPAPYARQHMTIEDLSHFSDEAYDTLLKQFEGYRYEGLFTPPDLAGTMVLPGTRGGSNWGGGAIDPATGILYVKSNDSPEIDLLKMIDVNKVTSGQTPYLQGRAIYMTYCANCHGRDKGGIESQYPSLLEIEKNLTKDEALTKVLLGAGRMPSFANILKGKEEAIIAYLFEIDPAKPSRVENYVSKIHSNQLAGAEINEVNGPVYLNTTSYGHFLDIHGNPGIKPPWGTLNAIDLNTGEYAWKIPIGNDPELQEPGAPPTGVAGYAGPIVTSGGLVFIGGTYDKKFRAIDTHTGEILWETSLPAIANATPCTYWSRGKQYIAISVAGSEENPAGSIICYALPD